MTLLLSVQFAWMRYRGEVHLRRALQARAAKNWPSMAEHLDRIDRRYYAMDPSSAPVAWYRGVARFEIGDRAGALLDFTTARTVHPNHAHVLNNIATCQTLLGQSAEAVESYAKAIAMAPRFEEARVNLAFLLHSLGRDQEAYDQLAPIAATATSARFRDCLHLVRTAIAQKSQ
jgi:Flp pilus assembly protein TadD